MLGTVSSSTIISTISASGQITASDQIDVKAKVTGTITWIGVKEGARVRSGQAIATIDATDAKQAVREAESTLTTSKLQYQKDTAQAPIDFQKAQSDLGQSKQDLEDDYIDTFNKLSEVYLDLPTVITGAQNALYGYDMSPSKSQWNVDIVVNAFPSTEDRLKLQSFADAAQSDFEKARDNYDAALITYKSTSRTSSQTTIDSLLQKSTDMTTEVAQAVQSELNLFNTATDLAQRKNITLPSYVNTLTASLRTYLSTANTSQTSLLTAKKTIQTDKQAIVTNQNTVDLLRVGNTNGANPISLQISANSIASAESNLAKLKSDLLDYTVYSPFDGIVASVSSKVGDQSSAAIASIITSQQLATLSLNEVDAAKIKIGQRATLTFDAIDDLTLTGKVASIDAAGTVSQGVVSYDVKIAFDTFDDRAKTGMTVNANIIIETAQDVLSVPSSAVKTTNGQTYVQVFNPPLVVSDAASSVAPTQSPQNVAVVTGISDDTTIQIVSGLKLGEQIVVRTVTGSTNSGATTRTTTNGTGGARTGAPGGGGTVIRF